jgi:COPII coat assembly protein SEC16
MSTAGEAAALFSTDDSATDPFSLSAEGEQAIGQDPFAGQELHSATDLFGSAAVEDIAFAPQVELHAEPSHEYTNADSSWNVHDTQYASNYSDPAPYSGGQNNVYEQQSVSHAYNAQQAQWPAYEVQQYNPPGNVIRAAASSVPAHSPVIANGAYTGHPSDGSFQYAPYNATNAYTTPAASAPASYAPHAPTTHDPYAYNSTNTSLPASTAYDPYKSSMTASAPVRSAYDPYKPSSTMSPQTRLKPLGTQDHISYGRVALQQSATSLLVPATEAPRSAAAAEVYRPKTSNAYDPPLPPPKPSAKRTTAPTWQGPGAPHLTLPPTSPSIPHGPPTAPLPPPPQRPPSMPPPPRSKSTVSDYVPPPAPSQFASVPTPLPVRPQSMLSPSQHTLSTAIPPPHKTPYVSQHALASTVSPPRSTFISQHTHQTSGLSHTSNATVSLYVPSVNSKEVSNEYAHPSSHNAEVQHTQDTSTSVVQTTSPLFEAIVESSETLAPRPSEQSPAAAASHNYEDPEGGASQEDDFWGADETAPLEDAPRVPVSEVLPQQENSSLLEQSLEGHPELDDTIHANVGSHPLQESQTGPVAVSVPPVPNLNPSPPRQSSPALPKEVKPVSNPSYDPYSPSRAVLQQPSRSQTPADRATSPGSVSIRSRPSSQRHSLDQDRSVTSASPYTTRQSTKDSIVSSAYDPYNPSTASYTQRTASPSSFSIHSIGSSQGHDPYAPTASVAPSNLRNRATSNGSALSYIAAPAEDPYAPSRHRQSSVESSSYRNFSALQNYPENLTDSPSMGPTQVVNLSAAAHAPYAPSPSLLGTNDPLGRTSVRVPVISFGFGGKLVTCFHGLSTLSTGFDVAMSSRASSIVDIRPLYTTISQSALDTSAATYPGPLFADPGTPTTALVRTGASAQVKSKKARVIKYLEERVEETSQGIGYLHQGTIEGSRAEAKLVMIKLIKIMVENDGKLSGRSA